MGEVADRTAERSPHEARHETGPHTLSVKGLHVHYGNVCALRDVTFETHCGQAVALVGANGAGKSSLMKAIVGLTPSTSGTLWWRGQPISTSTHEIAYLPQREKVDWTFPVTVRGLVEMGRYAQVGLWRPYRAADRAAVERALARMAITDIQDRQINALSGGQQQRAFIARALAQEAHVLLLDEPYAGLDQPSQDTLTALLQELARQGCLIMAAHHDLRSVGDIFDTVLVLNRALIACGPPREVMTPDNLRKAFGT
ncbi:MAG: metal ABC transporter ATP-binding protein [Lentisphaerae bacterium]|nr:metal ABC transporter ATP-binding protein [Lentisphaerota bacterium]